MDTEAEPLESARRDRDQSLACAAFALVLAAALVASNVGADAKTEAALAAVARHRELLAGSEAVLKVNQADLAQNAAALAAILKSQGRRQ
jgi:hypothetical protein